MYEETNNHLSTKANNLYAEEWERIEKTKDKPNTDQLPPKSAPNKTNQAHRKYIGNTSMTYRRQ